jgi:CBS domain-containing protein
LALERRRNSVNHDGVRPRKRAETPGTRRRRDRAGTAQEREHPKSARESFIRHLPVVDGSGVIGMVSIGDLVKAVIQDQQALIEQLESYLAR